MAVSEQEKKLRNKVVATALKMLREHADLSQPELAAEIAVGTDPISVSRWERGVAMPHPGTRERLAEIAVKHGRKDLAAAFADPTTNWRATVANSNRMIDELLIALELAAINLHILQGPLDDGVGNSQDADLWDIAEHIQYRLFLRHQKGKDILLLNDAQKDWWYGYLKEMGADKPGKRRARRTEKKTKTTR
jgi:transcriptional regulator with XRE-family HTH domain